MPDKPISVIQPGDLIQPGPPPVGAPGGIHNRPSVSSHGAESGDKAECPKFMSHGPCGGVRKGGFCEVFPDMMCPWVVLYFELEKIGQTDWMTKV